MPVEGIVNALRTIHAALVPGGLVVDTQPVSIDPPVEGESGELGRLDMREWGRTIEEVDREFAVALRDGLFALEEERSFVVAESYDGAAEMLTIVRNWHGTRIPEELEQRIGRSHGAIQVPQVIRLRLLRAL